MQGFCCEDVGQISTAERGYYAEGLATTICTRMVFQTEVPKVKHRAEVQLLSLYWDGVEVHFPPPDSTLPANVMLVDATKQKDSPH